MKRYLVIYYSKTGNSKFLAEKIANELGADLKKVSPLFKSILLLYLCSLLKVQIALDLSPKTLANYDEVIMLGPIWGGLLISPLRSALAKAVKAAKPIHFAVSCETSDAEQAHKYGYAQVLQEARKLGGGLVRNTEAFSTALVKEHPDSPRNLAEKTRITEANFKGAMQSRLEAFLARIQAA